MKRRRHDVWMAQRPCAEWRGFDSSYGSHLGEAMRHVGLLSGSRHRDLEWDMWLRNCRVSGSGTKVYRTEHILAEIPAVKVVWRRVHRQRWVTMVRRNRGLGSRSRERRLSQVIESRLLVLIKPTGGSHRRLENVMGRKFRILS